MLRFPNKLSHVAGVSILLIVSISASVNAQASLQGVTPSGLAPGAPAGSHSLSGFESVNPFNGNLNFHLPIVSVGGRGGAGTGVGLLLEQKWQVVREVVDPDLNTILNYPDYNHWGWRPAYVGASITARRSGNSTVTCVSHGMPDRKVFVKTLTRLTVTLADGTEFELRDTRTGGEPKTTPKNINQCATGNIPRGEVFITADGTAATFVSDAAIFDESWEDSVTDLDIDGDLFLADGSSYRFDDNRITWIRDRNGNKVSFSYGSGTTTVTDSLNRQVIIDLNITDGTHGLCDKITYKGFGGTTRYVYVTKGALSGAFRSGYSTQTYAQLFPSLNGSSSGNFDPTVYKSVVLPNSKTYQFSYNSYGELARVVLPTGGAIEYDWDVGESGNTDGGVVPAAMYSDYGVYRRVMERRVYADGSTLESKMIYDRAVDISSGAESYAITETKDASNNLLAKQKSYFFGSALQSFSQGAADYGKWRDTREYKTESFDFNGSSVLRRSENTFAQRASVSWWGGSSDDAPPNDPRTTETVSTLVDTSQVSKQEFTYDQFNNRTDTYDYDFGSGSAGSLIRRTHTDFLTTNSVNSTDYSNPAPSPTTSPTPAQGTIHIRNLPTETWVSSDSGGSTKLSKTTFEYDNYTPGTNHAALVNRSSISGHDSGYTTSYTTRGNATAITRWNNLSGSPTGITTYQQYDIAGNVVKIKDARGNETTATYGDSFGAPNGNATTNTSPGELSGVSQTSYAFATSVTNALGTVYSQFDFYTGMPVDGIDLNGVATSGYSTSDSLDRPTQIIRAVGEWVQNQTTFAYDDTNKKVTTTSDLASSGDNALKTESFYDGLGRTTETRRYEGSSAYIKTTQTYDALGRIKRSYNPHRTSSASTDGYAENTYDALGRVTNVETSDGADVTTAYSGNAVTVTDQASKTRRSITDGMGRLTAVHEPDQYGSLGTVGSPNQATSYAYDVLGNLLTVTQGSQTRTFAYDNLSRLTSAANPESGAIAYQYDDNGNLTKKTDARNVETNYTYDSLNRVTQRSYATPSPSPNPSNYSASPTVTYTYDNVTNAIGKLTKVSNSNSETYYTAFDKLGRVTTHKQRMNSVDYTTAYTYNLAGMLLEETYPSGRMVKNTIGSYGDLTQVETKPSGGSYSTRASNFTYSAPGAVSIMQLGNGLWEGTDFNERLQPTEIKLGTSSGSYNKLRLQYGYGTTANNGNVLSQTITVPTLTPTFNQTYTYDELNRLATAGEAYNGPSTWSQTYGYDRYGNRNITAGTGTTSLTFDASTNKIATSGYTYDAAGNTIADPSGKTYVYDSENKQTQVSNGGTLGTYYYDGDGTRVKKDASTADDILFIYDAAGKLIEECDLSGNLQTSYVYSGGRLLSTETAGPTTNYLTADHLGSPRVNTDGSGNVTARHDYMPFGEEITPALTAQRTTGVGYVGDAVRKQFTGYERDGESGLDFAQARMNSSNLGRFTSPDPAKMLKQRMADPQHWNFYVYGRNNPLLFIDPSGEFPWTFFVRSFIQTSAAAQSGGTISGDGRVASLATDGSVTSRIQANFTIDYDNGRITNAVARSDSSTFYGVGGVGQETRTSNPGMAITLDSSRLSSGSRSEVASLHYAGKLPFGPSSAVPDIDVHARIGITETKTKYGNGSLSINGSVAGDTYPSNESFVVDQSGKGKVFLGAKLEEGGPGSLYGDNRVPKYTIDMKINFDKNGNFTSVVSGGKTYKVDDWNKKVQREF